MPDPSTSSSKAPGKLAAGELFGRYRIEKQLGEGAMGAVFLAQDTRLNDRPVALKVPKFTGDDRDAELQRFHREAGIAATLSHPNLCPVYDVGELDGVHYLAMGFIDGKPLNEVLGGKPLAEKQAALLVRKIALAMQAAHDKGVVHRDLKPANVMLDARREPIVMDFGLAKQKGGVNDAHITQSGMILGTPAYMSPEQVNGELDRIGPPADVYSLGVILYELLTGVRPFQGPITAVLGQILSKEPPPPRQHRPKLDPRLEAITLKAMAKRIEARYRGMTEFAAALADYVKQMNSGSSVLMAKANETAKVAEELSLGSVAALVDAARQCLKAHDYAEAVRLFASIPFQHRSEEIEALRSQAAKRQDEVDGLQLEIDLACEARKYKSLAPKLERLLKLKPGHDEAKKLLARLNSYGDQPAKYRFNDAGELQAADRSNGLFEGMGLKYAAVIGTAVVAFGIGLALIYPYLRRTKSEPPAPPSPIAANSTGAPPSSEPEPTASPPARSTVSLAELLTSPDYEWTVPENLGSGVNTGGMEFCWGISDDEQTLYYSRGDLYVSRRGGKDMPFTAPRSILALEGMNSYHGALSGDGLMVVASKKAGENQPEELWSSARSSVDVPFPKPQRMLEPVNTGKDATVNPAVSNDGLTLLACTTRPPSESADVWMFTRNSRDEPFANPQHLAAPVSTRHWDMPSHVSNDRTVIISAVQSGTLEKPQREYRVYTRQTEQEPFGAGQPTDIPMGEAEYHDYNGSYRLSADGRSLYFHSLKLQGGHGLTDLYVTRRAPKGSVPKSAHDPAAAKSLPGSPDSEEDANDADEDSLSEADTPPPGQPSPSEILTSLDWEWGEARSVGPNINTAARESSPSVTGTERVMYFVRDGVPMICTRPSRTDEFDNPRTVRGPLARLKDQEVQALSVTNDGVIMALTLRSSVGRKSKQAPEEAVYLCQRDRTGSVFREPVKLPKTVNASPVVRWPWISRNGLGLIVSRPGSDSRGKADLYLHTRISRDEPFGPAIHLDNVVNTQEWDFGGSMTSDRLVLFRSTRFAEPGKINQVLTLLCTRTSTESDFGSAYAINAQWAWMMPAAIVCSRDGKRIYFQTTKNGDDNNLDLYMAERVPKK